MLSSSESSRDVMEIWWYHLKRNGSPTQDELGVPNEVACVFGLLLVKRQKKCDYKPHGKQLVLSIWSSCISKSPFLSLQAIRIYYNRLISSRRYILVLVLLQRQYIKGRQVNHFLSVWSKQPFVMAEVYLFTLSSLLPADDGVSPSCTPKMKKVKRRLTVDPIDFKLDVDYLSQSRGPSNEVQARQLN